MLKRSLSFTCREFYLGTEKGIFSGLLAGFPYRDSTVKNFNEININGHGPSVTQLRTFHQSTVRPLKFASPEGWLKYNEVIFPPTKEGEAERPAEVYHQRAHIKYQFDKMLYMCRMVRGMSVDEAKKQLTFRNRAGAAVFMEVVEEAQEMAVNSHNVEYKSNMWIAEAFPTPGGYLKGNRKHARGRMGSVHYHYIHLFIKLREGQPPDHYYAQKLNGHEHKERYLTDLRKRKIINAL